MLEITKINRILDKESHNLDRMHWAVNRIAWLVKFHKAPADILDALVAKCTATLDGTWYGDEPAEQTIRRYCEGV